jgi:arylsulfatase A-like enzyme
MDRKVNEQIYNWWLGRYSPAQNEALFDLAKEAIHQLQLGQRNSVDFLSIAVKLTDRVGHDFGPRSLEQLDVIYRLDRLLGDFFQYLDTTVGEENYIIALSADHGAPNISEYEQSQGRQAVRVSTAQIEEALRGVATLIDGSSGDMPARIARELEQYPFVARAMTPMELQDVNSDDPYIQAYRNSYLPAQPSTYPLWTKANRYGLRVTAQHPANYGVVVDLSPRANLWAARSTHGGSHSYDREVPILFMGKYISADLADRQVFTRDVAPTLARLSGVNYPATVDGRALKLK